MQDVKTYGCCYQKHVIILKPHADGKKPVLYKPHPLTMPYITFLLVPPTIYNPEFSVMGLRCNPSYNALSSKREYQYPYFSFPKSFEIQKAKLNMVDGKNIFGVQDQFHCSMYKLYKQVSQIFLPSHQTALEKVLVHEHYSKATRTLTVLKEKVFKVLAVTTRRHLKDLTIGMAWN